MKLDELQRKLLAAARSEPPDDRVPYAFEQRVMARLRAQTAAEPWADWARALWRATAPCLGVVVLLGTLTFAHRGADTANASLAEELESTMYAALEDPGD